MIKITLRFLTVILFSSTSAWAGSYYIGPHSGANIMKSAYSNAKVVKHLPRLTDVKVVWKLRGWSKIQVLNDDSIKGWVHSSAVYKRYKNANPSSASSFLSFINTFKPPPAPRQNAALGTRGLDASAIALSKSTPESQKAVQWMEHLQVSEAEVANFVQQGDLNP